MTRFSFTVGMKMIPVLLGWYLYTLTQSKFILGMVGLSEVVPAILLALPAGVKVDRSDRHRLITKCLGFYLMTAILLGCLVTESIPLANDLRIILIFLAVGVTGFIRAYISPAFSAFLAQLVAKEHLVKAASVNSMAWLLASILGAIIAGWLVVFLTESQVFIIISGIILLSIFIFKKISPKEIAYQQGKTKTWESVREGLDFVWSQKALFGAMGLDMLAVLFGGAVALLPVFAQDILNAGPQAFGYLTSATYLGNFVAILFLTYFPLRGKQGAKLIWSIIGFGVCIIVFAWSKSVILSFVALFVSGLFDGVSVIVRGTIFQIFVPDQMRGRVSAVNSIFINSSNELGQFESGVAASLMGTVPSVVFGGTMTILVSALAWIKIPSLKKLEY